MTRNPLAFLALAALTAAPAMAEEPHCDDWWFARNLIYDRAGQCFSTPLAQALFDNSDCTTTAAELSPDMAGRVAQIRELETRYECAVDTTRTELDFPYEVEPYRQMEDIPVRDAFVSGCIGYRGPEVVLRSGARPDAPPIDVLRQGMSIGFGHFQLNGFDYLTVLPEGVGQEGTFYGWAQIGPHPIPCDGYAN